VITTGEIAEAATSLFGFSPVQLIFKMGNSKSAVGMKEDNFIA
jgi:hypothetical protein